MSYKKIILLIYLALIATNLIGQHQNRDSLLHVLHNSEQDTSKIYALKWLTWHYYFKSSDSSKYFLKQMINLSADAEFTKGLIDAYNIKGILYYTNAHYDSAISTFYKAFSEGETENFSKEKVYSLAYSGRSYQRSTRFKEADSCFYQLIDIALESNDSVSIAKGYKSLAQNHSNQGDYQRALKYHFKADTFMIDDVSIDHAENYQNIGIIYNTLGNTKSAVSYFDEALKIYRLMNDEYGVHAIMASIGSIKLEEEDYQSAKNYLEKAHAFFKQYNDPEYLANINKNLGRTEYLLGNYKSAIDYLNSALAILENMNGSIALSNTYLMLGKTYLSLGDFQKSIDFHEKALQSAEKHGDISSVVLAKEALADAYYLDGNHEKAYNVLRQNLVFKDSINTLKSDQTLHDLGEKYLNEKKEQEIKLLTTQNLLVAQQRKNQLVLLGSIVILLTLLSIFLFILYKGRQKTTKKLRELDTVKSNFFANISHEFRTPLTLIKNPVEDQLAEGHLDNEDRKRLEMIDQNTDRLLSLVDQLLDLAKLDAGNLSLHVSKLSISKWIKAMIPTYEYAAKQREIDFSISYSEKPIEGWIDQDILEKMISNLFSNAVKYTKDEGYISMLVDEQDGRLIVSLRNSIEDPESLKVDKLFERFYRQNETEQGSGIGLALAKELAELHKGSISAYLIEDDILFEVQFPIRREAYHSEEISSITHEKSGEYKAPHINQTTIPSSSSDGTQYIDENESVLLIVEDNADLAQLIHDQFKADYQILISKDGDDGIKKAIKFIPDLIISDIMMPKKDGIELTETLKRDERTSHIPIILLTAKTEESNKLIGIETGADDYITKPFNKRVLDIRVRKLIEQRVKLRSKYSKEVILHPKEIAITPTDEKFLLKIQDVIENHLTDPEFNAESFSKEMGMSRMQLHRKLTALLSVTATEFIRTERLKMAAHLLKQADVSISEIGYAVGFNDPSYFTRCFKESYGMSPKEYTHEKVV